MRVQARQQGRERGPRRRRQGRHERQRAKRAGEDDAARVLHGHDLRQARVSAGIIQRTPTGRDTAKSPRCNDWKKSEEFRNATQTKPEIRNMLAP